MTSFHNSGIYITINNIPKSFHSNHLRNFFLSFVESGSFICFHYKHRREVQKLLNFYDGNEQMRWVSNCCIVNIAAECLYEFIKTYDGQHWFDGNGETLLQCCFIKEIKLSDNGNSIHTSCGWTIPTDCQEFSRQEVEYFPEMHPPFFMPNGNVGTTTDNLLKEINNCGLPPRVIRKLHLLISANQMLYPEMKIRDPYEALYHKVYRQEGFLEENIELEWKSRGSGVCFYPDAQYCNTRVEYSDPKISDTYIYQEPSCRWTIPTDCEEFSRQEVEYFPEMHQPSFMTYGNVETSADSLFKEINNCRLPPHAVHKLGLPISENQERIYSSEAFDSMSKKDRWKLKRKLKSHRFNSKAFLRPPFHDRYWISQLPGEFSYLVNGYYKEMLYPEMEIRDPYEALYHNVYRQERLLEENIGLEWKNKESGVLFYLDAQYWNTRVEYSDPKKSDAHIYQEPCINNDKDMRDLVTMNLEKHRNDTETEVVNRFEFAGFEKYNKGIGRKILEAQGWKQGQGIGKNGDGIAEPLPNEGQIPSNKKGLGYQAVKKG